MEWQPIETAPKDGTAFLGIDEEGIIWHMWWAGWYEDVVFYREHDPTHWMPLPKPPSP